MWTRDTLSYILWNLHTANVYVIAKVSLWHIQRKLQTQSQIHQHYLHKCAMVTLKHAFIRKLWGSPSSECTSVFTHQTLSRNIFYGDQIKSAQPVTWWHSGWEHTMSSCHHFLLKQLINEWKSVQLCTRFNGFILFKRF